MAYKSAYKFLYRSLTATLRRESVKVGGTAHYPRVELHSFIESQALDKALSVRVISVSMESISDNSLDEAIIINEGNLALLPSLEGTSDNNFRVISIIPTQLQDLEEASDSAKVIYRQIQTLDITIQQL